MHQIECLCCVRFSISKYCIARIIVATMLDLESIKLQPASSCCRVQSPGMFCLLIVNDTHIYKRMPHIVLFLHPKFNEGWLGFCSVVVFGHLFLSITSVFLYDLEKLGWSMRFSSSITTIWERGRDKIAS